MNPLPRFLAFAVFVILALLSATLALPLIRGTSTGPMAHPRNHDGQSVDVVLAEFATRASAPLAVTGAVLALVLVATMAAAPRRGSDTRAAEASGRLEIGTLAKLAESSASQSERLAIERDERLRAEANALLHQQLLNRSLAEKIRLGRDLHDGVIQSLYATGLTIESARAVAATDAREADERLAQCLQLLNQTIRDVRTYIAGLAPENVRQASFADAVQAVASELTAAGNAEVDLHIDDAATVLLTPEQSTETLQIAREAVSNSVRHGQARRISVRLHVGDGEVGLLVQDDGKGFNLNSMVSGNGLANMRARAESVGGKFRVESAPGTGTHIVLTIPVQV